MSNKCFKTAGKF